MSFIARLLILIAVLFGVLPATAEMTVGAEFEFIDPLEPETIAKGLKGHEEQMAQRLARAVRLKCHSPCFETVIEGKWGRESRFDLGNGFWFQVSWDPNVVEIVTKPLTVTNLKVHAESLQNMIFESAKEAGLTVDPAKRAGHFNFGAHASFDSNPTEFLKYIIDFSNRPELSLGILRSPNILNAPPLSSLKPEQRAALGRYIEKFQKETWVQKLFPNSISRVSKALAKKVFNRSSKDRVGADALHYQALGLKSTLKASARSDRPVENRAVRSQRNIYDFILLAELAQGRIEYLKTLPPEIGLHFTQTSRTQFSQSELANRFFIYVMEANLSWDRMRELLPEDLRREPIFEILRSPELSKQSHGGLKMDILRLMDLTSSSPWFVEALNSAILSNKFSAHERSQISQELFRLGSGAEYSEEARRVFREIGARAQNGQDLRIYRGLSLGRAGACSQVLL